MAKENPLKICLATSELTPLAKTGGLAHVASSLAAYLHHAGHDVRVLLPFYSSINTDGLDITLVEHLQNIPLSMGLRHGHFSIDRTRLPGVDLLLYLLRCPEVYARESLYTQAEDEHRRFILLARAAIEMCQRMAFAPDIFSCHDWHTALVPLLAGKRHCKLALLQELQLEGSERRPLIGIVTRLAGQKGVGLMEKVLPGLLQQRDFSLAVLGSGEARYERFFKLLHEAHPERVHFYRGYNNKLAHWIEAGADMFLMPSAYEPCGLNQMYNLKYGTVPIVRHTGGLADSVHLVDPASGAGTGILFRDYNEAGLSWAINSALELYENKTLWQKIVANGMAKDFSWDHQGDLYVKLFRQLSQVA